MAKITLETTNSGFQSASSLRRNFTDLEAEFQNKVLYRNNPPGEANQMENDLDMNSNDVRNVNALDVAALSIGGTNVTTTALAETELPIQTGNTNRFLRTNGTVLSWEHVDTRVFDTVAAMKADTTLTVGQHVITKGYTASGDNGGASYAIVSSQSADGFGDHTLANTNVAVLQHNGTINILNFGAIGDEVADDTAAIQAAFDYGVLSVYAPAGIYIFTTLTVSTGLALFGDGEVSTEFQTTGAGGILVTTNDSFRFEDFRVAAEGGHSGVLIDVNPPSGENTFSKMKNLRISNYFRGIRFVKAALWIMEGCHLDAAGAAGSSAIDIANTFDVDSGDSTINGCLFFSPNALGDFITHRSSGGLRVINNKFLFGAIHYHMSLDAGADTFDLLFSNNSSEHADVANLSFDHGAGASFANVLISNNQYTVEDGADGIIVNAAGEVWLDGLSIGEEVFGSNLAATCLNLDGINRASVGTNVMRMGTGSTFLNIGVNLPAANGLNVSNQTYNGITNSITGNIIDGAVSVEFSKTVYFNIADAASVTLQLDKSVVDGVAHLTVGGTVQTVGIVGGVYIASGTSSIFTVLAISGVTVTTNGTSVTLLNSTGQTFSGRIIASY